MLNKVSEHSNGICVMLVEQVRMNYRRWIQRQAPNVGLEPTTLRLRVSCSGKTLFKLTLASINVSCFSWRASHNNYLQIKKYTH
jgi:hypothetical protein